MAPAILIIIRDQVGDRGPILILDLREKMRGMERDLPFRLPESGEINSHDQRDKEASEKSVSKIHQSIS